MYGSKKIKQDIYMPRVSINTPAPDFNLTDYTGKAFKLSALRNQKNVLLVFNRTFA
jgi:peroxiredoxin